LLEEQEQAEAERCSHRLMQARAKFVAKQEHFERLKQSLTNITAEAGAKYTFIVRYKLVDETANWSRNLKLLT
jgi:hypothetical protein